MATLALVILTAGCSDQRTVTVTRVVTVQARPEIPALPGAGVLPPGYRTLEVYRAEMSGNRVSEVVLTSTGPATIATGWHHSDIQVLSWDPVARRWTDVFDAQKVNEYGLPGPHESNNDPGYPYGLGSANPTPILDATAPADLSIDQVRSAPLLGSKRDQLVFSATYVWGGGVTAILTIVDLQDGVANVIYTWTGRAGLGRWHIAGNAIHASADYFAPGDPECCPSRTYEFAVAARGGYITEVCDNRPFLGVVVRPTAAGSKVIEVAGHGPAAGHLRVGDVILDVENAPPPRRGGPVSERSMYSRLSRLDAGQTARLLVDRDGVHLTVSVKLGSLSAPAAERIMTSTNDGSTNAL